MKHHLSDSQANAEALARRTTPYSEEHGISASVAFDYRKREPRDLREAVHLVRQAFADEIPDKMHDSAIGDDGTPRMNARAYAYIFGPDNADDAGRDPETGQVDLVGELYKPFRSATRQMMVSSRESHRKHGAIAWNVTVRGMGGVEAAIIEGVPSWCAGEVAFTALRAFLNQMSRVRVHPPKVDVAETYTAA